MTNNDYLNRRILESIQKGVLNGLNEYENINEGKFKNFALGAAMLGSVASGMTSCSNINPAYNPTQTTQTSSDVNHIEPPDYSDRPWAYESYIGREIEASWLVIQNKYLIKKLFLDLPGNADEYDAAGFEYYAEWQDCLWAISYVKTEKRDNYFVDTYYTFGGPLGDTSYDGIYYDGSAYFELWYTDNESKPMNERAHHIRIYRNEQEKRETCWTVLLNKVKQTSRIDINNDGPNHGR